MFKKMKHLNAKKKHISRKFRINKEEIMNRALIGCGMLVIVKELLEYQMFISDVKC